MEEEVLPLYAPRRNRSLEQVNWRMPPELIYGIEMLARRRRDTGTEPSTRQAIAAEAIEVFLKKHGIIQRMKDKAAA